MVNHPVFKSCFQVELLPTEGVLLVSETQSAFLRGEIYLKLAIWMDGEHTALQISEELRGLFSPFEISYALVWMQKQGYVVEAERAICSTPVSISNLAKGEAAEVLASWQVALREALSGQHIPVAATGLEIVITDNYLRDDIAAVNQQTLASRQPWILIKPLGEILWLGPLFLPGRTGCWQCLAQRLWRNRPIQSWMETQLQRPLALPLVATPSTLQVALGLVTTLLTQRLTGKHPLVGQLVTVDLNSLQSSSHTLVRRPQCSACGDPELQKCQMSRPIWLSSCPKRFAADGGYRSQDPEETLEQYRHHISPYIGVVRELTRSAAVENRLIHTYRAPHWFPLADEVSPQTYDDLTLARSGGKGKTRSQAEASGLCEAIERYSGVFHGDELRRTARFSDLGEQAIHPNACMLFSDAQYQEQAQWNTNRRWPQRIPAPFDPEQELEWTPVWSLTEQRFKYLPAAYCFYGYPIRENPYCYADSNGCAAGNTLEEAILQGFLELVERDSVALWWYNQLIKPGIDLSSFADPYCMELQQLYQSQGRDLWVLDLTSDLRIPVVVAISSRIDTPKEDIVFGFGSHFDIRIAIGRALTEINQVRASLFRMDPGIDLGISDSLTYLFPDRVIPQKTAESFLTLDSNDIGDVVKISQHLVQQLGMEFLVLDQTRPDIGLKVVKVVVPGLRHFWRRLGAGRLYEVPVTMGWLSQPKQEKDLNPITVAV